jgi:hypothetical protein
MTENTKKFMPGTPQHTLQKNRLHALRIAKALIIQELEGKNNAYVTAQDLWKCERVVHRRFDAVD